MNRVDDGREIGACDSDRMLGKCCRILEGRYAAPEMFEVSIGDVRGCLSAMRRIDGDEAIGIRNGQLSECNRIRKAEGSGVSANPECKRKDRERSESRRATQ